MLKIQPQRKVQFVTVERPTAWLVVAFLTEMRGEEAIIVSKPKIVKVILKRAMALLEGKNKASTLALPAPKAEIKIKAVSIKSPYVSVIFGYSNSDVVIGLAARPPTNN